MALLTGRFSIYYWCSIVLYFACQMGFVFIVVHTTSCILSGHVWNGSLQALSAKEQICVAPSFLPSPASRPPGTDFCFCVFFSPGLLNYLSGAIFWAEFCLSLCQSFVALICSFSICIWWQFVEIKRLRIFVLNCSCVDFSTDFCVCFFWSGVMSLTFLCPTHTWACLCSALSSSETATGCKKSLQWEFFLICVCALDVYLIGLLGFSHGKLAHLPSITN